MDDFFIVTGIVGALIAMVMMLSFLFGLPQALDDFSSQKTHPKTHIYSATNCHVISTKFDKKIIVYCNGEK